MDQQTIIAAGCTPAIAEILADLLAWEADCFDPKPIGYQSGGFGQVMHDTREEAETAARLRGFRPDTVEPVYGDLNVSGADLVDAFTQWRIQLRAAMASGSLHPLIAAGDDLASCLEEAESQHVYDFDAGDEQPDDCGYKLAREAWAAAKVGQVPVRTVVIEIEGGMISAIKAPDGGAGLQFMVIDHDTDTGHETEVAHEVLNDDGDWEEVILTEITAEAAPIPETREITLDADERETRREEADPIRPGEFERAIMVGYKVNPDPFGGWEVTFPDDCADEDPEMIFATERAAWEAADNHRMFGTLTGEADAH